MQLLITRASEYLVQVLAKPSDQGEAGFFEQSKHGAVLYQAFQLKLEGLGIWSDFENVLQTTLQADRPFGKAWQMASAWLNAYTQLDPQNTNNQALGFYEALSCLLVSEMDRSHREVDTHLVIDGLLGEHANIEQQQLHLQIDEFMQRLQHHQHVVIPGYERYLKVRQQVIERHRQQMRINEFMPKPLSSFVRNQLISESYLPLVGDNLAKQMGTADAKKRSDLMGLLIMISPPGYGKTTLMEYIANRLGLVFMKVNCPAIGHDVVALDPEQAPHATAAQEIQKINLAFEMANNVMLYLDDIQHTHPEFLQKFISLCDGTRRIEGIWQGQSKTYDLRGKKFCIVMAGNPYTESGETFKIPDMLANRADIYNLGDVLSGTEKIFALSYLENALTSNPVLAPLATRPLADFYQLVGVAEGKALDNSQLSYQYSQAETKEMVAVIEKMMVIRDVVLSVNQQYIASSAQADAYRQAPPFKLQGSYRNMNKMTEKISAVMSEEELTNLINDHYQGEAQLLTQGAEENLLQLAQLRGQLNASQTARWQEIVAEYLKHRAVGGDDIGEKIAKQLYAIEQTLTEMAKASDAVATPVATPEVTVVNQPMPGLDKILTTVAMTLENSIYPLIKVIDGKLDIDLKTHQKMTAVFEQIDQVKTALQTLTTDGDQLQNK